METENCKSTRRYENSDRYAKLLEIPYENFDAYLDEVVDSAKEFDEEELLDHIDVLVGFVCKNELPSLNEKILDVTVDELLPVLNKKDSKKLQEMLSEDYRIIINNLEEIQARSDTETASKRVFAQSILTFPGSKIIDSETGLEL